MEIQEVKLPIIEIAYNGGKGWPLPPNMSQDLYGKYVANEASIGYEWDWGGARPGSWSPNGEVTTINQYILDFASWTQTNINNNRKRSFRIVWVLPHQVEAQWTGQIVPFASL